MPPLLDWPTTFYQLKTVHSGILRGGLCPAKNFYILMMMIMMCSLAIGQFLYYQERQSNGIKVMCGENMFLSL